jgi:hypothetical protein
LGDQSKKESHCADARDENQNGRPGAGLEQEETKQNQKKKAPPSSGSRTVGKDHEASKDSNRETAARVIRVEKPCESMFHGWELKVSLGNFPSEATEENDRDGTEHQARKLPRTNPSCRPKRANPHADKGDDFPRCQLRIKRPTDACTEPRQRQEHQHPCDALDAKSWPFLQSNGDNPEER